MIRVTIGSSIKEIRGENKSWSRLSMFSIDKVFLHKVRILCIDFTDMQNSYRPSTIHTNTVGSRFLTSLKVFVLNKTGD